MGSSESTSSLDRPLRVLMLCFACEPDEGSEPEVGWRWAHEMSRSCDVTVVTQSKNKDRIERWYHSRGIEKSRVKFSYLELGVVWRWLKKRAPGGLHGYYTVWQWRLVSHVSKLLDEKDFDIIHHVTFASFRMPVLVKGRPVVWGPVGGAELAPVHLLSGGGDKMGRLREKLRNLSTRLAGQLVRAWEPTVRTGGAALASTPATARLLESAGIRCETMPTIGFEIDEVQKTSPAGNGEGPLRILYVGRLHLLKGLHLLLDALGQIDLGKVELSIVGDGMEKERLERQAHDLGLDDFVTFFGYVPRKELSRVYNEHEVIVAPSLYESGGLSVLEGFAHGLPAVVLDCGGHALSVNETCGFKIDPKRSRNEVVNGLSSALSTYESDRVLVRKHGEAARRRLRDVYGWDEKHQAMSLVYSRVVSHSTEVN